MKRVISLLLAAILVFSLCPLMPPVQVEAAGNARYCVLVLEVAGSLTFSSGGVQIYEAQTAVEYVKSAAVSFLSDVGSASGNNQVAVVTYEEDATVVSGFTNDMDKLSDKVRGISEGGYGRSIAAGLEAAQELLDSIEDPNATKNVILFTTGMTNQGTYNYDGHYDENTVGSSWYDTGTGVKLFAFANEAYTVAQKMKEEATIYTLGLFQVLEQMPEAGREVAEFFHMTARDLASAENCFYDVADPSQLEFAFSEIAGDISAEKYTFRYAGQIFEKKDGKDMSADCYYTDDFFFKRASLYNPSLATMSLCLELSSWSSHEKKKWYDPDIQPENPAYWEDKLVNAKSLLVGEEGLRFEEFAANAFWEAAPQTNSIGVCAARKTIKRHKDDPGYTLIAVVVRGGGYGSEWGSNFEIGEDGDHAGFDKARDEVIRFLKEKYIPKIGNDEPQELKLWIVGYSRGGATANMVAGTINDNPYELGRYIDDENIFCYTFEAPQGVYEDHLTGHYENIHNVVNTNDLVPLVAPSNWGFYRYNHTATHYLPSRYTTNEKTFQQQKNAMLQQLEDLGYGRLDMMAADKDFAYAINEYAVYHTLKINPTKFLPGGDPLWEWIPHTKTTQEALDDVIDLLADDLLEDRETYYTGMEGSVSRILSAICHYDGKIVGIGTEFLDVLKEYFTIENMMYIVAPMFSLNPLYTYNQRMTDVELRAMEKASILIKPWIQDKLLLETIEDVLGKLILNVAEDVWDGNYETLETLIFAVDVFTSTGFQPHFPEITLAWCRSLDPNYNTDVAKDQGSTTTRIVRINCPVDVYVYDTDGNLVASIIDDVPSEDSQLVCYLNSEGEKIFYLPGDTQYQLEIQATDSGTVNYTVSEYNMIQGGLVSSRSYYDIPVTEGDSLQAYVSAASRQSLKENSQYGTDAQYELQHNGYTLYPDTDISGTSTQIRYTVQLQTEGTGGYASGAGSFEIGSFAQLEAYTLPGADFIGWYSEYGELLSEETVYRFAVQEDCQILARFDDVELYDLKIKSTKGGTVQAMSGSYCADMEISILAVPEEGYRFVGWTTTAGDLSSEKDLQTTLTMPGRNVTITAQFEAIKETPKATQSGVNPMFFVIGGGLVLAGVLMIVIGVCVMAKKKNKE